MSAKTSTIKEPSKSAKSKAKPKSRIAGLSALNKKRKFNWKIVIIFVVVLVVALGYLFIRLSKAQNFGPDGHFLDFYQFYGTPGQKDSQGTQAVGTMNITEDPNASFYYSLTVQMGPQQNVAGNPDFAYIGLQYAAGKKKAIFSVWNGISGQASPGANIPGQVNGRFGNEGTGWQTMIDYAWSPNVEYQVKIRKGECSGTNCFWYGSVKDPRNNSETVIGKIYTPYTLLREYVAYFHEMYSPPIPDNCVLPRSVVIFRPVVITTLEGKLAPITSTSIAVSPKCRNSYRNTINGNTAISATGESPPAPTQPDTSLGAASPAPAPNTPAPSTPAPNTPDCANMNNGIGNQNFCVSMIQQKLKQLGYGVEVDGIYGQKTADNVKIFQQKTGLTQDGVVGPRTWARLVQANSCSDPAAKQGCTL